MGRRPGFEHSHETRRRMSEAHKRFWADPEKRARQSDRIRAVRQARYCRQDAQKTPRADRGSNAGRQPELPEMTAEQRRLYKKLRRSDLSRDEALREIFGDHVPPPRERRR